MSLGLTYLMFLGNVILVEDGCHHKCRMSHDCVARYVCHKARSEGASNWIPSKLAEVERERERWQDKEN